MDHTIFLPTLPHWQFGNNWSGSAGRLRFFITTSDREDGQGKEMLAEVWDRDVCRELAQILEERTFPCTQEGLDGLRAWLEERAAKCGRTMSAPTHAPVTRP